MKTDSLAFRFFKEFPDCFFELVGRPAADAVSMRASEALPAKASQHEAAIPRPSIRTFAPPATDSRARNGVSVRPSRKIGDVIPWSRATMRQEPVSGSRRRRSRIRFPVKDAGPDGPMATRELVINCDPFLSNGQTTCQAT